MANLSGLLHKKLMVENPKDPNDFVRYDLKSVESNLPRVMRVLAEEFTDDLFEGDHNEVEETVGKEASAEWGTAESKVFSPTSESAALEEETLERVGTEVERALSDLYTINNNTTLSSTAEREGGGEVLRSTSTEGEGAQQEEEEDSRAERQRRLAQAFSDRVVRAVVKFVAEDSADSPDTGGGEGSGGGLGAPSNTRTESKLVTSQLRSALDRKTKLLERQGKQVSFAQDKITQLRLRVKHYSRYSSQLTPEEAKSLIERVAFLEDENAYLYQRAYLADIQRGREKTQRSDQEKPKKGSIYSPNSIGKLYLEKSLLMRKIQSLERVCMERHDGGDPEILALKRRQSMKLATAEEEEEERSEGTSSKKKGFTNEQLGIDSSDDEHLFGDELPPLPDPPPPDASEEEMIQYEELLLMVKEDRRRVRYDRVGEATRRLVNRLSNSVEKVMENPLELMDRANKKVHDLLQSVKSAEEVLKSKQGLERRSSIRLDPAAQAQQQLLQDCEEFKNVRDLILESRQVALKTREEVLQQISALTEDPASTLSAQKKKQELLARWQKIQHQSHGGLSGSLLGEEQSLSKPGEGGAADPAQRKAEKRRYVETTDTAVETEPLSPSSMGIAPGRDFDEELEVAVAKALAERMPPSQGGAVVSIPVPRTKPKQGKESEEDDFADVWDSASIPKLRKTDSEISQKNKQAAESNNREEEREEAGGRPVSRGDLLQAPEPNEEDGSVIDASARKEKTSKGKKKGHRRSPSGSRRNSLSTPARTPSRGVTPQDSNLRAGDKHPPTAVHDQDDQGGEQRPNAENELLRLSDEASRQQSSYDQKSSPPSRQGAGGGRYLESRGGRKGATPTPSQGAGIRGGECCPRCGLAVDAWWATKSEELHDTIQLAVRAGAAGEVLRREKVRAGVNIRSSQRTMRKTFSIRLAEKRAFNKTKVDPSMGAMFERAEKFKQIWEERRAQLEQQSKALSAIFYERLVFSLFRSSRQLRVRMPTLRELLQSAHDRSLKAASEAPGAQKKEAIEPVVAKISGTSPHEKENELPPPTEEELSDVEESYEGGPSPTTGIEGVTVPRGAPTPPMLRYHKRLQQLEAQRQHCKTAEEVKCVKARMVTLPGDALLEKMPTAVSSTQVGSPQGGRIRFLRDQLVRPSTQSMPSRSPMTAGMMDKIALQRMSVSQQGPREMSPPKLPAVVQHQQYSEKQEDEREKMPASMMDYVPTFQRKVLRSAVIKEGVKELFHSSTERSPRSPERGEGNLSRDEAAALHNIQTAKSAQKALQNARNELRSSHAQTPQPGIQHHHYGFGNTAGKQRVGGAAITGRPSKLVKRGEDWTQKELGDAINLYIETQKMDSLVRKF